MSIIRILLVDDQHLFRRGLSALIASEEDMEIVGEASDGLEALEKVVRLDPDVVITDIKMPIYDGVEAIRLIKKEGARARILALTVSDEDVDLFEAIRSGADGYLLKDTRPEDLFIAIRGLARGESPISPAVAGKLLAEFRQYPKREREAPGRWDLTQREREVLELVARGLSNAEIAGRLHVVEGTVKGHLHSILEKLHLKNRVQAAAYALREGIVSPTQPTDPASRPEA